MSKKSSESDWKRFRKLRIVALERLCERALTHISETAGEESQTFHERFLANYKLMHKYNDDIASAFDHLRRSKMVMQLARMHALDLIDSEDCAEFSEDTREAVGTMSRYQS
jgi:hypothetical protein